MKAMRSMHNTAKDLNLLRVFKTLYEDRNVSRAAKRLFLSQPALSRALARLRENFGDELFVRVARGVAPTPKAHQLKDQVLDILQRADSLFADSIVDLRQERARLVINTTDYFEHILLPRMMPAVRAEAPGVQLVMRPTSGALPKEEMERGHCDLGIAGFFGAIPEGFHEEVIMEETYSCVVRKDHPRVRGKIDLKTYAALDHVLISTQGDLKGTVDIELAKRGLRRNIAIGVSGFHTPLPIVAASDMIVTMPTSMARLYGPRYNLRILEPPIDVPLIRYVQVWHERTHHDPVRGWLRALIKNACILGHT